MRGRRWDRHGPAEALRVSELRYRRLFESAKDGILILDADTGMITDVNPFLIDLLGFSREEFLGKKVWELGFFKDLVTNQAHFLELQQRKYIRYEDKPLEAADGRRIRVEFVSNVYLVNDRKVIQCNIRVRQRAAEADFRLVAILDHTPDLVSIADPEGRLTYMNSAGRKMLGIDEWVDITRYNVRDFHNPADAQVVLTEGIPTAMRVGHWRGTTGLVALDGHTIATSQVIVAHKAPNGTVMFFSTIARDITDRKRAEAQALRLIEGVESANRAKSDFMATMSHELRTPLNIIMGYADLLLQNHFGSLKSKQVNTLQRIQRSATELSALIDTTLDIGRLDTGKLPVDVQEIDLDELRHEIIAETIRLPHDKPTVHLVWDIPRDLPRLHNDRAKLKTVIRNLLINALKFTDQGEVTVRACASDGGVEISVADTGVGIGPEILPIIFEPFRQGDNTSTRHYGGVGLGLYIVRRYLDLLGGTIRVESAVGRGSTFRVWLPLTPGVPELQPAAKA